MKDSSENKSVGGYKCYLQCKKKIEIHLSSGPLNFSFHLPSLKYYTNLHVLAQMWQPVWQSGDKFEANEVHCLLGF